MPSLSDVLAFRTARFKSSMALIEKKGHDYNRQQQEQGDTLFNLKAAEILGIVPTAEQGILVRLTDKLMRLISLTAPGIMPANREESVLDTINDIHNYVDYLGLIWLQRSALADVPAPVTRAEDKLIALHNAYKQAAEQQRRNQVPLTYKGGQPFPENPQRQTWGETTQEGTDNRSGQQVEKSLNEAQRSPRPYDKDLDNPFQANGPSDSCGGKNRGR